ncbi:MAG: DUF935 domain-containing protein [Prevotellaceae bacterium]|jgi:hypothetical protein|nr:DUF935 domain-containing protein [Prevotellaceae bacterium]
MTNTEGGAKKPQKIIINDLTLVAPDRNRKDIAKLKSSIERAESIYTPSRVELYDLYHDITTIDGHLAGILQKRKDFVLNKSISFVDKNKRKIDTFENLIYSNKFNRLIELIIESKFWGISGIEFIVGKDFDFDEIPRKHIRIEKNMIVKSQYDYTGISIDELPFVWTIGRKNDLGLLLKCSMYALYKRSGFGDFAQYVEIFGQPVRIIYYDAYDTKTKQDLRKILTESGGSLAMMIPKQAQFQMLDGKTSNGTGELQERLIHNCNAEMSVAILGNTETTTSSSSSGYAQSVEQGRQQLEITKSDISFVQNTLNEPWFLDILKSYGYPVDGGSFEFEFEIDLDNLIKRLQIDTFVSGKVPVADDYYYETYGIPKPDNYDELKAKQEDDKQAALLAIQGNKETHTKEADEPKNDKKNLIDTIINFFGLAPKNGASADW